MTHAHDGFKYLSPRDYVDTKSWLAYEQNPCSTYMIKSERLNRHALESVDSQVMNLRTDKKSSWSIIEVIFIKISTKYLIKEPRTQSDLR
jgi:hypothetical protein